MLVSRIMARDYPSVDKDETLLHAVRVMEKKGMDRVLVFEDKRLVGIMTKKDIMSKLATLRTRGTSPGRLHVSSFMSINLETIGPDVEVYEAARLMVARGISSLPVVEGDEVVGLVTKWQLLDLVEDDETPLTHVAVALPARLRPGDRVLHARRLILDNNIPILPVVDEANRVIGTISVDELAYVIFQLHDLVPAKYMKERITSILVMDAMRMGSPTLPGDATLGEAARMMKEKKLRGVIVAGDDGPTGLVSLDEVAVHLSLKV